jgi:hypothetical protein
MPTKEEILKSNLLSTSSMNIQKNVGERWMEFNVEDSTKAIYNAMQEYSDQTLGEFISKQNSFTETVEVPQHILEAYSLKQNAELIKENKELKIKWNNYESYISVLESDRYHAQSNLEIAEQQLSQKEAENSKLKEALINMYDGMKYIDTGVQSTEDKMLPFANAILFAKHLKKETIALK